MELYHQAVKLIACFVTVPKSQPVTYGMIQKEIMQVNQTGLLCHRYGFFSKSGFKGEIPEDIFCRTLDDLYKLQ